MKLCSRAIPCVEDLVSRTPTELSCGAGLLHAIVRTAGSLRYPKYDVLEGPMTLKRSAWVSVGDWFQPSGNRAGLRLMLLAYAQETHPSAAFLSGCSSEPGT